MSVSSANGGSQVEIVRLGTANKSLLSNVAPDVFDHEIHPGFLDDFLGDPRHFMYLAVSSGAVVGMASAVEYFHPDKPPQVWINEVGVAAPVRRHGIGRRLVQALLDEARQRGCASAWLGTDAGNKAAGACFGSVPGGEEPQAFFLYEWDLDAATAER